jgi:hypothetical protein
MALSLKGPNGELDAADSETDTLCAGPISKFPLYKLGRGRLTLLMTALLCLNSQVASIEGFVGRFIWAGITRKSRSQVIIRIRNLNVDFITYKTLCIYLSEYVCNHSNLYSDHYGRFLCVFCASVRYVHPPLLASFWKISLES